MGHFLEVAHKVLSSENRPLSAAEITAIGLETGWLETKGKTPRHTMKSKLSVDILRKEEESLFMRIDKGLFVLREWKDRYEEYVADRFKKGLLKEDIVVFPATVLPGYIPVPGLHNVSLENSRSLLDQCYSMPRHSAEEDFDVIQLVSVFILKYKNEYITYKRAKRLPESRLHGCYSLAFGGHLNPEDVTPLFDIFEPQNRDLLVRELNEEVLFPQDTPPEIQYKGLLYDNSRDLSSQHLGIVYDVRLSTREFKIGERGFLLDAKFETLDQIESRIEQFENWSVMLAQYERASNK